jgi:hypothetical protein
MRDARYRSHVIVLLSTALVKPEENATEGGPECIYPQGRVQSARCIWLDRFLRGASCEVQAWQSGKV